MNAAKTLAAITLLLCIATANAQQPTIQILDSAQKTSLRGLSAVSDDIVWASGSNGTVARSIDGGKTFIWMTVPGCEKRDFRDIQAFDENNALIMGIGEPAVILQTDDGGKSWLPVFIDTTKGMFLDAMDFHGRKGVVIGDPINDYAFIAYTKDGGYTWHKIPQKHNTIQLQSGEAFFASSGTNIKLVTGASSNTNQTVLVSGGTRARLITENGMYEIPMLQGSASGGANSIDVWRSRAVIVGGDFAHDTIAHDNCVMADIAGNNIYFDKPKTPPHGYRSCVIFTGKKHLVTCGTSGVDISTDGGKNWRLVSTASYHVCQKAKSGSTVFLAGSGGRIAKLVMR